MTDMLCFLIGMKDLMLFLCIPVHMSCEMYPAGTQTLIQRWINIRLQRWFNVEK